MAGIGDDKDRLSRVCRIRDVTLVVSQKGAAQAVCSGVDDGRSCVLKGCNSLLPRLDDPELWQKKVSDC